MHTQVCVCLCMYVCPQVVSSLRYMVTERPHPVDTPLAAAVGPFLALVSDAHHTVRRAAVVALAAIAHQKPALVTSGRMQAHVVCFMHMTYVRKEFDRVMVGVVTRHWGLLYTIKRAALPRAL